MVADDTKYGAWLLIKFFRVGLFSSIKRLSLTLLITACLTLCCLLIHTLLLRARIGFDVTDEGLYLLSISASEN